MDESKVAAVVILRPSRASLIRTRSFQRVRSPPFFHHSVHDLSVDFQLTLCSPCTFFPCLSSRKSSGLSSLSITPSEAVFLSTNARQGACARPLLGLQDHFRKKASSLTLAVLSVSAAFCCSVYNRRHLRRLRLRRQLRRRWYMAMNEAAPSPRAPCEVLWALLLLPHTFVCRQPVF